MKTINVLVRDKIASAVGDIVYICGNSDYIISFDFDAERDAYSVKTARFVHNGTYTDVVFTGNQCAMPVIHKAFGIFFGVDDPQKGRENTRPRGTTRRRFYLLYPHENDGKS